MKPITFNIQGRLFRMNGPAVMGILNITPDSFYTKGQDNKPGTLIKKAGDMIAQGAHILDLGAVSTRPGATQISAEEEWSRLSPVLKQIKKRHPDVLISVDTYRSEVARRSVLEGAGIINDISAGNLDDQMIPLVGKLQVPYIAMHMQGKPQTMQDNPEYANIVDDILTFFIKKIAVCEAAGIKDLILDPGFGFGKNLQHNYTLLKGLHQFRILEKPLLTGFSRKSMIYKLLETTPENALNGTSALHMLALAQGTDILRVHDVSEARECIRLWNFYQSA